MSDREGVPGFLDFVTMTVPAISEYNPPALLGDIYYAGPPASSTAQPLQ
jgi:hypothetical protein